jgi:hypothetical protein
LRNKNRDIGPWFGSQMSLWRFWPFLTILTIFDDFRRFLTILTIFDDFWQFLTILTIFDDFWRFWQFLTILTIFDDFWQFLTILTIFDDFFGDFENRNHDVSFWKKIFRWKVTKILVITSATAVNYKEVNFYTEAVCPNWPLGLTHFFLSKTYVRRQLDNMVTQNLQYPKFLQVSE